MPCEVPLKILRGKTFEFGFRYAENEKLYLPIAAMVSKAPVRLTVLGHGIPDGWPVRIECVKQPEELNTPAQHHEIVKVVDADIIELNALNATCWKDFLPPGVLVLPKPMNITDWSARAQVRDRVGGDVLFTWHSDPAENPDGLIEVDPLLSAFVFKIDAATTADLPWRQGVYDAEVITPTGEVYALTAVSPVKVIDEVTA